MTPRIPPPSIASTRKGAVTAPPYNCFGAAKRARGIEADYAPQALCRGEYVPTAQPNADCDPRAEERAMGAAARDRPFRCLSGRPVSASQPIAARIGESLNVAIVFARVRPVYAVISSTERTPRSTLIRSRSTGESHASFIFENS
jgi:hypothetical protein